MVNYDIQIENNIRSQGYGIKFTGMDTSYLQLYLHRDELSDKKLGDKFLSAKIGNPKTGPNSAELQYLARKATAGLFAWMPGEDCLAKAFENIEYVGDGIGGATRVVRSEPFMGCQWCRERSSLTTSVHEAGVETFTAEPVIEITSAPPSAFECPACGYVAKLKNRKGNPYSSKQRAAQLKAHTRGAHTRPSTPVNSGVPVVDSPGAGKE